MFVYSMFQQTRGLISGHARQSWLLFNTSKIKCLKGLFK